MPDKTSRILVVDDEKVLLDNLVAMLKDAGYEVLTADNGEGALQTSFDEHPDLIMLDYSLPKQNGVKVLSQLREDDWGKDVPVIMMTNLYDIEIMNTVMQLGVKDYILKSDISLDALLQQVGLYVSLPEK